MWEGLIPSGMLTVAWGNPGVGKSQLLTDIAARVSRGDPMPCFDGEKPIHPDGPGNVLLVSSEDDPNSVMRPRLEAAEADLKRVHLVGMVSAADPTELEPVSRLAQLAEQLEAEILRVGSVRLIGIDPIADLTGDIRPGEVRDALRPLQQLAAKYGIAIVYVAHVNKQPDASPMMRLSGPLGWIAVPRSALLVGVDPDDPQRRLVMLTKTNNAGQTQQAMAFTFRIYHSVTSIEWERERVEADSGALLNPPKKSQGDKAEAWLQKTLADGPQPSNDVKDWAKSAGISTTLRRAKDALGISAKKDGAGSWTWALPTRQLH